MGLYIDTHAKLMVSVPQTSSLDASPHQNFTDSVKSDGAACGTQEAIHSRQRRFIRSRMRVEGKLKQVEELRIACRLLDGHANFGLRGEPAEAKPARTERRITARAEA